MGKAAQSKATWRQRRDAIGAARLLWFRDWYGRFLSRQFERRDWVPLSDIYDRLRESGASHVEARARLHAAMRDGWFNRKHGRCGAWVVDPLIGTLARLGSPEMPVSVWLYETADAQQSRLFKGCWVPRDLLLRWCDNCDVSARPVWRDADRLPELRGSDLVRLRLLRPERIAGHSVALAPRSFEKATAEQFIQQWYIAETARRGGKPPSKRQVETALKKAFPVLSERRGRVDEFYAARVAEDPSLGRTGPRSGPRKEPLE